MKAKNAETDEEMRTLITLIGSRQPISRKEIISNSPFAHEITVDALNRLMHSSMAYMDGNRHYSLVPESSIGRRAALKEIIRMHFKCFGIFSAEQLYRFIMSQRMGELRASLAELEDEGLLVKGFFREGDPTVMWMLKDDINSDIEQADEMFLLNTQDNLHVYLREMIKQECGSSENVIFDGTKIAGSFKGKLTITGAKTDDLRGTDAAVRFVKELSAALGVRADRQKREEDKDWDVCEFYHKTHPGSIKKLRGNDTNTMRL
jgi:ATP-dependent Lhr-like helicase